MTGQDEYPDRLKAYLATRAAFHRAFGRQLTHVVLFPAFLDESASHPEDDTRVYTIAGFVSTLNNWTGFDSEWSEAIAPLGVPYFHMTEYERAEQEPNGKYGRDLDLSKSVFNKLLAILRDYELIPFGMTADLRNWSTLPDEVRRALHSPYYALMRVLTKRVAEHCHSPDGTPEQILFIFEEAPTAELIGICTQAFNAMQAHEPWGKKLADISFVPKGRYRGNEAADILAYDMRKHVRHLIDAGQPLDEKSKALRYSTKKLTDGGREVWHWYTDFSDARLLWPESE